MTATSHAVIGTVIAAKVGNPYLAVPIAMMSHIAADAIPHWDTVTNGKLKGNVRKFIDSAIDVVVSFIITFLLLTFVFPQTSPSYAFFIVLCSQALDWLTMPYYFFGINFPFKWVYKFQKLFDSKLDKPWGIITQLFVIFVVILLGILI